MELAHLMPGVARALLGEPNKAYSTAKDWRYGNRGSLSVRVDTGTWFDHEASAGGGVLDLVQRQQRISRRDAMEWLEEHVGLLPQEKPCTSPLRRPEPVQEAPAEDTAHENYEAACELWRRSVEVTPGTPGWVYLTEQRGLHCWNHDTVRYLPDCPVRDRRAPAIIAPVNAHKTHLVVGVWRIILDDLGRKIERMGLGPTKRNCSRLVPWAGTGPLAIAEGVEDAIAVTELTGKPCWAALSAGNMAKLILPSEVREVHVYADADANGGGIKQASILVHRLRAEGRTAVLFKPNCAKDANAVLQGAAA